MQKYYKFEYAGSEASGELQTPVTYTLWVPPGVVKLRGIVVHQHGAGTTASKEGSTAAFDLHWQALARKWDCALFSSGYHVRNEKVDLTPGGSEHWFDPRRGSEKVFLKALDDFASQTGHAELAKVPWVLWGHSGGGIWADVMTILHPDRVVACWLRSGSAAIFRDKPEFPQPTAIPEATYAVPSMCNPGVKEKKGMCWIGTLATFKEYRAKGAPIGFAPDPRTDHECGDSRYLAIPFLDACMAARLPDKWNDSQTLKPIDQSKAWLAPMLGNEAVPAAHFKGNPAEAVWLPNEAVAKAWMEYVKTGAVGDTTPPPTPFDIEVTPLGDKGTQVTWNADADFESGIGHFLILRDGKEYAKVPEKPVGKFGRPLFQSMTYHDTPDQPMPQMRFVDSSAKAGEKHAYQIVAVNSVGLKSNPSAEAPLPYLRVNSTISFRADPDWPERRPEIVWGPMSGVFVDANDNVWALSRKGPAVMQYRSDGKFLKAWGEGLCGSPHELKVDRDGNVWIVDSKNDVVLKCTPEGKVLMTLGTPGERGCDEKHFAAPNDIAITPAGDVYISDGYVNARVVHFDKDGKFIKAWGKLGIEPGEFNLPHGIAVDSKSHVYVADRNNARVQVFDADGNFLDQWRNILVPSAFSMTKDDELWVVGTSPMLWRPEDNVMGYPPKDQLIMRFNTAGKLLQLWAFPQAEDGKEQPGNLNWAHGISADSKGNIYIVDVMGKRLQKFVVVPPYSKPATAPSTRPAPDVGASRGVS